MQSSHFQHNTARSGSGPNGSKASSFDARSRALISKPNTTAYLIFPPEILALILVYTNLPLRNLTIPSVDLLYFFNRDQLLAEQAADLFLWGRVDESISIVSANPELLTMTVEREGPAGRVKGPIYRIVLWTDDAYIPDANGKSAKEAFKELLIQHHGVAEEQKQHTAQFPEDDKQDWKKEEVAKIAADRAAFNALAKAFDESKVTTTGAKAELKADVKLQDAIRTWQNYLTPRGVNTSGRCCMRQLWDYAAEFYTVKKYNAYGDYNSPKNNLFCQKGLGAIDKRQQAWGMQVLHGGIYSAAGDNQPVPRSEVSSYYDISPSNSWRLGDNCFMSTSGGTPARDDAVCRYGACMQRAAAGIFFELYIHQYGNQASTPDLTSGF